MKIRITESLDVDLAAERWRCHHCGHTLADARVDYKTGCLVAEVSLEKAHPSLVEGAARSFTPDPDYCRLIEFYCPGCTVTIESEYLPPGHPPTHEIELDIDALKRRYGVE